MQNKRRLQAFLQKLGGSRRFEREGPVRGFGHKTSKHRQEVVFVMLVRQLSLDPSQLGGGMGRHRFTIQSSAAPGRDKLAHSEVEKTT